MQKEMLFLSTAGNVEAPCFLVLLQKGFTVTACERQGDVESWQAVKDEQRYTANSLVELLGLISLVEVRGAAWQASDEEIDRFLQIVEDRA